LRVEHETTVDRVLTELRRALFDGELQPGTPLREVALAESLGVSRSTVREALGMLVAEGLAVRVPNRGTAVRTTDPHAIRDVSRARTVLEVAGIWHWDDAAEGQRDAVRSALTAYSRLARGHPTNAELNQAHLAIHRSFVGLTGSERLVAAADALNAEIRLALASVDRSRRNAREQLHSHSDLVKMLESGDVEGAAAELGHHLAHAEDSMLGALGLDE
ncbi:MAG: GntR family transcriptional regulator, partial [Marmoricola sp.]